MRRTPRVSTARSHLRKTASATSRRSFPAWIDADQGISFAAAAEPRVRDSLVLRPVNATRKPQNARKTSDVRRAR